MHQIRGPEPRGPPDRRASRRAARRGPVPPLTRTGTARTCPAYSFAPPVSYFEYSLENPFSYPLILKLRGPESPVPFDPGCSRGCRTYAPSARSLPIVHQDSESLVFRKPPRGGRLTEELPAVHALPITYGPPRFEIAAGSARASPRNVSRRRRPPCSFCGDVPISDGVAHAFGRPSYGAVATRISKRSYPRPPRRTELRRAPASFASKIRLAVGLER